MIIDAIIDLFNAMISPLLHALPQYTPSFPTDSRFVNWLAAANNVVPLLDVLTTLVTVAAGAVVSLLVLRFVVWLYKLIPGKFT